MAQTSRNQSRSPRTGLLSRRALVSGALGAIAAGASHQLPNVAAGSVQFLQAEAGGVQAVGSSHFAATNAGMEVLSAGGSAADAAVAVALALSVVEPYFSHALGGGVWGLYYHAETGEVTALDGVGPAGSLVTLEDYATRSGQRGMHQANIPGSWDAWMRWLLAYGELDLRVVMRPAIRLARDGFAVSAEMAAYMSRYYDEMSAHPPTAAVYAPNGSFSAAGDVMTMPAFLNTLRTLAEVYAQPGGRRAGLQRVRDYFYRGPIAEAMVAESDQWGGYLTLEDFAAFEAEIVDAISIAYGPTMRVYQNPPNSQGVTMLLALNILKGFDFSQSTPQSAETIHSQVEAMKLAFGDRDGLIGDPAFVNIDLDYLLSDEHAEEQRLRIDMSRAMAWPETASLTQMSPMNTTTFQVIDRFGNAAAVTTSIGLNFLVVGDTGIHINERMRYFSTDPASPNVVAAGKKVRHTSCPYLVLRDGEPAVIGGNTGADSQPQVQLQELMHAVDFGLSAQESISMPRWVTTALQASAVPNQVDNTLQLEAGFPADVLAELQNRGHVVVVGSGVFGSGGMITVDDGGAAVEVGVENRTSASSGQAEAT